MTGAARRALGVAGVFPLIVFAACSQADGTDGGRGPTNDAGAPPLGASPEAGAPDATASGGDAGDGGPLAAEPGEDFYGVVGEPVTLDGSRSRRATRYQWDFGNGDGWDAPRTTPVAEVTYAMPGRYVALLTVFDAEGRSSSKAVVVSVTFPRTFAPVQSSSVAVIPQTRLVAVVSPDSNEVTLVSRSDANAFAVVARKTTCARPRTVTPWGKWLIVPCQDDDKVDFVAWGSDERTTLTLPYGARPFGAAHTGSAAYVTLQGKGTLARITLDGGTPKVDGFVGEAKDARGIAALPDGRLAVTRWRSPDDGGDVYLVDPAAGSNTPNPNRASRWALEYDPQPPSDTEIGGVPTYLNQVLVSPTGRRAYFPSLQANFREGLHLSGRPLSFEFTVRAVLSGLEIETGRESSEDRLQFDNHGFASAGAFSSRGDWLYVALRGTRSIVRVDTLAATQAGTLQNVGFAPEGLAVSEDDRFLFVDAYLSRELIVFDTRAFAAGDPPIARLSTVTAEPLSAAVLLGKRLFNDSADARLSRDGYMACAHCHLDGEADDRTWDFTDRGEGLRNTTNLMGHAGMGDGPVHWSANFDEIQDFEHDMRGPFNGTGLMRDEDFNSGTCNETLGDKKGGKSADLDALAAYVTSLVGEPRSPFRSESGGLTPAATRGKAVFERSDTGCTTCHSGPRLTDSGFVSPGVPRLHDVGTLRDGSGKRLGGTLTGIDTPTLHGLWHSAPYLHDGSAPTLRDVLVTRNVGDKHGKTSQLSAGEVDDLVAYLLSLDGAHH
jgi:DNA-binding beta-propeller fold protein YncE